MTAAATIGNCSPRFVRSTIYHVPTKKSLFETSRLPLAVVVQPLADVGFDEYDVPVVDLAPNGPLRCRRCGAYINPFVKFTDNGRSYACALCSAGNEGTFALLTLLGGNQTQQAFPIVPEYYFSPLELNGQRRDLAERVELWRGSVDFIAVNEQGTIAGEKPVVLFILDVSSVAITSGLVNGFVTAIKHGMYCAIHAALSMAVLTSWISSSRKKFRR
jgi:protein transport protein SEC24